MQHQTSVMTSSSQSLKSYKLTAITLFSLLAVVFVLLKPVGSAATAEPQSRNQNPVTSSAENIAIGLDHFDAHCATCHGGFGKADTEMGKSMGAADLTSSKIQSKSDAELYRAISNGVPNKGMPAFAKTHKPEEIWQTILFLRKLPTLTPEEKEKIESAMPAGARHHHDAQGDKPGSEHAHGGATKDQHEAEKPPAQTEHQHQPEKPAAQAEHQHQPSQPAAQPSEHSDHQPADAHAGHQMTGMNAMMNTITGGPFKSMTAIGSGTSLLPASTPGYMWHKMAGDWMLMAHGNLVFGFNHQGGPRGINKVESQNWLMFMGERKAGGGQLMLRGMFSAEPWSAPRRGFPELFQTGETFKGRPIVDAQHPHDLFMELAAAFTLPFSEHVSLQLYGGPVGEPALGPVAFMHRASASENPAAPLGHHWQDSTHIAHGVFTAGLTAWRFKVEGSIFRGAEPDENRKDIEMGKLDSWSTRIWFTPNPNWTMQFSHGRLTNPELLAPGDLVRNTASISYNRAWGSGGWASSLIWGRNHEQHGNSNSYLLESTINLVDKNYVYTRMELVDKQGLLEENIFGRRGPDQFHSIGKGLELGDHFDQFFRVGAFTFGGVRDIVADSKLRVGIGADVTFYHVPEGLKPIYGSSPTSFHFFLRLRPGKMSH
jgi:mono/diheme cytochrome c family protein